MEIKIGDLFFINVKGLTTWYHNDEVEFFCSCGNLSTEEDDMLVVVKYLGNGIVEEMVTHEKILMDKNFYTGDISFEDEGELVNFAYDSYFEEKKYNSKVTTLDEYLETLETIKQNASNYSLAFSMFTSNLYEISEDKVKEYMLYSDSVRRRKVSSLKKLSLEKTKDFIVFLDSFISEYDINDELTGDSMLDQAYFENKLYNFRNKEKVKNNI